MAIEHKVQLHKLLIRQFNSVNGKLHKKISLTVKKNGKERKRPRRAGFIA